MQNEAFKNGMLIHEGSREDLSDFTNEDDGRYDSLKDAIRGFAYETLGDTGKITGVSDINGVPVLCAEVMVDKWGIPATKTVISRWMSGEIQTLSRYFHTVKFIKKTITEPGIDEFKSAINETGLLKEKINGARI